MFDNERDAAMRLDGTIIRYKDHPVFVERAMEVEGRVKLKILPLGLDSSRTILASNPNFNYSAIPLGYVNTRQGPVFLVRIPQRRWKQGLDHRGCATVVNDRVVGGFEAMRYQKDFVKMYRKDYPTFKEVCESGERKAISRVFATNGVVLHYKGGKVGTVNHDGVAKFTTGWEFLAELWGKYLDGH